MCNKNRSLDLSIYFNVEQKDFMRRQKKTSFRPGRNQRQISQKKK